MAQQQQQQQRDLMEQTGNQIVHIRGDSDSDLEALFNAVMNPSDSQVPLTVPMRLRKLPNSFFKPPDCGSKTQQQQQQPQTQQQQQQPQPSPISHSRESSADSTQAANAQPASATATGGATAAPNPGLPIHHPRAHSSPASLQQNLVVGNQQHQHLRQQSYDITDDVPLPAGWEMASTPTGQRYFLNHNTQTTQWEDPRKKMSASAMNLHTTPSSSPSPPINPLSSMNLGPLPEGWEQASTPEGEIYFINHQARTTSWFDPRIPMQMQRPALLHAQQNNQPPPQLGRASASLQQTATNQMSIQQRQQRARLQRLEMERERLQSRQREIVRQLKVSTLNPYAQMSNNGIPIYNMDEEQQRLQQDVVMTPQEMLIRQTIGEGIATSPTTDLPPVTTTGMDPFLGSNEFHSRQESTDSGLGMGTNYSLPHTPEDYLSTMDDSMEPTSDNGSSTGQQHAGSDLGSLDLQSSDLNNLGDNNNMDSDDLEPSLQEELGSDILNDVEALLTNNRMDNVLTWL